MVQRSTRWLAWWTVLQTAMLMVFPKVSWMVRQTASQMAQRSGMKTAPPMEHLQEWQMEQLREQMMVQMTVQQTAQQTAYRTGQQTVQAMRKTTVELMALRKACVTGRRSVQGRGRAWMAAQTAGLREEMRAAAVQLMVRRMGQPWLRLKAILLAWRWQI